ncbi:MAG TPA: 1-acyl-sn-glycerol-3-phosphate acyltransferase [Acidobacteriota bacterium]|nr:1-acyl-sn-glycerol-3-phosphate acyltransferase [Acidobacteriota bacterium]
MAGAEALYRGFRPVMLAAIAVHFRRAIVLGAERFPKRGAVLVVANHPSTWSDVLLLDALLGRRQHFLAEAGQFHLWPRRILLRLFGTLPLWMSESGPRSSERNEETFRRCRRLFDRGEVVTIFPEGISRTDRSLMPLRRGAARLALSYARCRGASRSFSIIPIGLRYSDRTAFRSDVALRVGEPIPLAALRGEFSGDDPGAWDRLTERLAGALRSLAVLAEDPRDEAILSALAPIVTARERDGAPAREGGLERWVAATRRDDPEGYRRLHRLARSHARVLRALRVSDRILAEPSRSIAERSSAKRAAAALLAAPALVGAAIHALPVLLTRSAIRSFSYDPSQVAFARIASGLFFLLLGYAALAGVFVRLLHAGAVAILALFGACALLGLIALGAWERGRPGAERRRLAQIARRHPRLVERARRSREELARWVSRADRPSGDGR